MPILYTDTHRGDPKVEQSLAVEFVSFDRLLQDSDFITIHTPLTPDTYHLFSDRQFAQMKSSAILINTARGTIVDPNALYRALNNGEIAAAAIDVTDPEPIPTDSPLLTLENLIITPHIGSASRQAREKMATMAIDNLLAGLRGDRLPYCANPEVYLV
jgi:glyoxylate reductase